MVFSRLTDLQLALYAGFASFPVVNLTCVVIVHNLDELTRQCGVLQKEIKRGLEMKETERILEKMVAIHVCEVFCPIPTSMEKMTKNAVFIYECNLVTYGVLLVYKKHLR